MHTPTCLCFLAPLQPLLGIEGCEAQLLLRPRPPASIRPGNLLLPLLHRRSLLSAAPQPQVMCGTRTAPLPSSHSYRLPLHPSSPSQGLFWSDFCLELKSPRTGFQELQLLLQSASSSPAAPGTKRLSIAPALRDTEQFRQS